MIEKATEWLAKPICAISLCFSAGAIVILAAMWPGFLMQPVGNALIYSAAILSGAVQIIAISNRRYRLAFLLFAVPLVILIATVKSRAVIGPPICDWGPERGLLNCEI